MSLRAQVVTDFRAIVENGEEFGALVTITDPSGVAVELTALVTDHFAALDPETGIPVAGRTASVAIAMGSLVDAGITLPSGVMDPAALPWRVSFTGADGVLQLYRVTEVLPDRAIGAVVCRLEFFGAAP